MEPNEKHEIEDIIDSKIEEWETRNSTGDEIGVTLLIAGIALMIILGAIGIGIVLPYL
ncbi:MAG: hypothetical protein M0Q91_17395 [Methanoregula sp.]|nr:hypothetical protein [Methanoregula sp.]